MNSRTRRAPLRLLAAAVMLTSLLAGAAAAAANPFAGGHGNLISGGELRTFSFAVTRNADGTVTGNAEVKNRSLDVRAHIEIDCLKFEAVNRAIMSGPIIQSSNPTLIVPGRIGVFAVEDNGEGSDAPADRITTIPDYAPPKSCNEFALVDGTLRDAANPAVVVRTLTPILNGNIQVQP
ncbi:MAG: hypothetical protein ACRDKU_00275 [Gaiellaceae bacterium]